MLSPNPFDQAIHEQIKIDRNTYRDDPFEVKTFRQYAKGKHAIILTPKQKLILRNLLANRFCYNVSHQIIAEARDRLEMERWHCQDEQVENWVNDFYGTARLQARQNQVHYDALRDGNTCVALGWDPNRMQVQMYREDWWDGERGTFVGYDELDNVYYACKDWPDVIKGIELDPTTGYLNYGVGMVNQAVIRRTIWFDDRLERWVSMDGGASWRPFELPGDGGWPVPWLKRDGTPGRIPIVHFANSTRGAGNYGMSEIDGGAVGYNDQLNDLEWAMSACGRLTAFQMITGTGVKLTPDPRNNNRPTPPEFGPGQFIWSSNKDARFGHIPPGDAKALIQLHDTKLQHLAQMTRTPCHLIGGVWPSGDAILRAEKPAVGKAQEQISIFTDAWVSVAHKAVEVWNRYSSGPLLNEDSQSAMLSCEFANPERRDPLSMSMIVNNMGDRISAREGLRMMGYTADQIEMIMDEKAEEDRQKIEAAQVGFSRGLPGATGVSPSIAGTGLPGEGQAPQPSLPPKLQPRENVGANE
ncbi:MAG: hypothetical protein LC772_06620 [Chloroflexi bacterium]|nr:hypothetical protein [Chloroflexota bacterium]